jgi:hypothetical protein
MLVPIALLFGGSFSGSIVRAICLIAAAFVSTWIFYDTELAKGSPPHSSRKRKCLTGAALTIFILLALILFFGSNRFESWAMRPKKEPPTLDPIRAQTASLVQKSEESKKEPPNTKNPPPTIANKLRPNNAKSSSQKTPSKNTYQGFTETSPAATLSMGGMHILDFWPSVAAAGGIRTPFGQEIPIRCHLKENSLYCDANLRSEIGTAVSVSDNVFTVLVPTWDRNFTDDALEVVDERGQPMLQIIRRTPYHWEVNGVFVKPNGEVCVITEKQILFSPVGPNLPPEQKQINEMEIRKAEAEIKPIFKYPSYQHRGEFASE